MNQEYVENFIFNDRIFRSFEITRRYRFLKITCTMTTDFCRKRIRYEKSARNLIGSGFTRKVCYPLPIDTIGVKIG